ncbi:DnaB-like helicase C-terminal domain-containing protein [Yersinia rochesterensis]|uniref:DnaB-like helicase C-terminal domain-containing protein n=1 Tax=Yersinia rochesterensis TaxID=1604335 RepID=UPI0025AAD616|nr:DnaB-like helicase C-terminal domain-containing protein [Yersinia rochesterensis]MDN0106708.1 DnaB-like helicase C-terminal domain-containing protein [Yersinia rochesterensis]
MTVDYKTPPHNLDAEQSVLGGLMLDDGSDNVAKVLSMLKPESFYTRPHQVIFSEIKDLVSRQIPIDLLTLFNQMENKGISSTVGGFAYMAELSKNTPSAANIVHYAMEVRDKAITRYSIAKTNAMTELLYANNGMTATQKLEAIQALSTEIADHAKTGNRRGARPFRELMEHWLDEVEDRFSNPDKARGLSTGIASLDAILSPKGIVKGSLFIIGARPKMGKTTLYGQMAINCAVVQRLPAVLFSLEMPNNQIIERMVGQASGVNTDIFYRGADNDSDFARASASALEMANTDKLFIDDTAGATLAHIQAECRRIKRSEGHIGMVLVDYLTLMKAEKAERTNLGYGLITQGLKNLAKELDCVVVLLTQLNRGPESRTSKRPKPSDSRETGQIEQDCDYWLGIHCEEDASGLPDRSFTEYLLPLNRHGKTGVCYVEQRNGAVYDLNQIEAQNRANNNDESQKRYAKKGGF